MDSNQMVDAYITVQFRCNDLIDEYTLMDEFDGDLTKFVMLLCEQESIISIVLNESGKILSIDRI